MKNTETTIYQPNEAQTRELYNPRNSFPFRIIYGAFNPATGEWFASAVPTMRIPNKLAREGWQVFTVKAGRPRL
jgi:hypothetical protein